MTANSASSLTTRVPAVLALTLCAGLACAQEAPIGFQSLTREILGQADRPSRVSAGPQDGDAKPPKEKPADATETTPDGATPALAAALTESPDVLRERVAGLKERAAALTDETEKAELSAELAQALVDVGQAESSAGTKKRFEDNEATLPDELKKWQDDKAEANKPVDLDPMSSQFDALDDQVKAALDTRDETVGGIGGWSKQDEAALEELEGQRAAEITRLEKVLSDAKDAISKAEQEFAAGKTRVDTYTKRLTEVEAQLQQRPTEIADLNESLTVGQTTDDLADQVRVIAGKSKLARLIAEEPALKAERDYLRARRQSGVPELIAETLRLKIQRNKQLVTSLEPIIARARESVRADEVRKAKNAIAQVPEVLRPQAEINRQLAERAAEVDRRQSELATAMERATEKANDLTADMDELDGEEAKSEFSEIRSLKLRSELAALPSISEYTTSAEQRKELWESAQIELYQVEREYEEIDSVEDRVAWLFDRAGITRTDLDGLDQDARANLVEEAAEIAEDRHAALTTLKTRLTDLQSLALEVATKEANVADRIAELRDRYTGQLLWTRSHPNMLAVRRTRGMWSLGDRTRSLLDPATYARTAERFLADISRQPLIYILTAIFGVSLLVMRQWMRFRIRKLTDKAMSRANTSIRPLLRTIAITIADAAVWPGLLAFAGLRLSSAFADTPDVVAIGHGLFGLAFALFLTELIHDGCLPGGAAEVLGLPRNVTEYLRRKIFRLEVTGGPLAAVVILLHGDNVALSMQPIERLCFIGALFCLGRFFNQMLRSSSPVTAMFVEAGAPAWYIRLRPMFRVISIGVIVAFSIMSVVGYHNTAIELLLKLEWTIWLALGLLLLRLVLAAGVLLHRRRVRFDAIRRRVETARAAAAADESDEEPQTNEISHAVGVVEEEEDEESAVERLTGQSQRLIGTIAAVAFLFGTYYTWSSVLPALSERQIYPFEEVAIDDTDTKVITLGNLFAGIAAIAITITAARNVPGLLEFSVLERVGLDKSVRYAITTILSYVISLVGILITGKLFGFDWNNVQWLAAGLTVGLGFGLQEIFANFVSGLIIFFEQPIRVGDIVTIDDVTGVVSRIRIRATTITNWDRKEYIVPNREFITGRLLNWTLSDSTNRLVLHVGIAYGSDTERAREVLFEILRDHPAILDDPGPLVTLEELGDSSVNFVIRCYLPTLDNRLAATHELYTEIHRRFGVDGIEIPFPQRDLHVRAIPAGFGAG